MFMTIHPRQPVQDASPIMRAMNMNLQVAADESMTTDKPLN
jgi:hypothetical protein